MQCLGSALEMGQLQDETFTPHQKWTFRKIDRFNDVGQRIRIISGPWDITLCAADRTVITVSSAVSGDNINTALQTCTRCAVLESAAAAAATVSSRLEYA